LYTARISCADEATGIHDRDKAGHFLESAHG
jgi:hypothetical protein